MPSSSQPPGSPLLMPSQIPPSSVEKKWTPRWAYSSLSVELTEFWAGISSNEITSVAVAGPAKSPARNRDIVAMRTERTS